MDFRAGDNLVSLPRFVPSYSSIFMSETLMLCFLKIRNVNFPFYFRNVEFLLFVSQILTFADSKKDHFSMLSFLELKKASVIPGEMPRELNTTGQELPPRLNHQHVHSHGILISSTLLITEKDLSPLDISKSHSIYPRVLMSLLSLSNNALHFD